MKRVKKVQGRTLIVFVIISVLSLIFSGLGYAQDPGIPDTIRFDPWGTYIPCPPCTGHAIVPLVVYNDEYLLQMYIILQATGPVSWDSGEFVEGERVDFMTGKVISIYKDLLWVMGTASQDSIPPGKGILSYLYLSVQDTGAASLDTAIISEGPQTQTIFTLTDFTEMCPEVVLKSERHLSAQDSPPGDANGSGEVNVVDVVFLINYLFRNGPEPAYPPCADPNVDCWVTVSDVVYLINYVLKSGATPHLGCAY
jgi:hypothetical protein